MTDSPAPVPPTTILELPYHRLYRAQPTYRWWRPLVALVLTVIAFLGVQVVLGIGLFVVLIATGALDLAAPPTVDELNALLLPDMVKPWTLLFGLGAIILTLPLVPLALRIAGIRPAGVRTNILHSVLFRLRWGWLRTTLAISAAIWVGVFVVQVAVGLAVGEQLGTFSTDPTIYLISLAIVVVLVPFQAATEEYLYRGVLLQVIGSWVRWAIVGIAVSAAAFAFSHIYDAWGLVQVGLMGAGFAYVAIRTGGLEAGIAFHTVNNIGSFALAGTGMFGPTGMTAETGGGIGVLWQLATVAIWVGAIEWFARRRKIEKLSRIAVPSADPGMLPPYGS